MQAAERIISLRGRSLTPRPRVGLRIRDLECTTRAGCQGRSRACRRHARSGRSRTRGGRRTRHGARGRGTVVAVASAMRLLNTAVRTRRRSRPQQIHRGFERVEGAVLASRSGRTARGESSHLRHRRHGAGATRDDYRCGLPRARPLSRGYAETTLPLLPLQHAFASADVLLNMHRGCPQFLGRKQFNHVHRAVEQTRSEGINDAPRAYPVSYLHERHARACCTPGRCNTPRTASPKVLPRPQLLGREPVDSGTLAEAQGCRQVLNSRRQRAHHRDLGVSQSSRRT